MRRFRSKSELFEYYKWLGCTIIQQVDGLISVENTLNDSIDYYEFIDGFWILTD